MPHIVIIGNGIAGSTASRYIRKYSDHTITMISDETEYPFSRTALMYIYMGHMKKEHTKLYEDWFWGKNRIQMVKARVKNMQPTEKKIVLDNDEQIKYDKLIIASGSKSNMFDWPGQNLQGVQGLYFMQDLDKMETATQSGIQRAVIVGGGLIGVEMAEMFFSRKIPVTFVVRERSFWNEVLPEEESAMINQHLLEHGIDLRLNTEIKEIKGTDGRVTSVILKDGEEEIPCNFVGITVGVSPNIDFVKPSGIQTHKGIVVNSYLQTSVEDVFAIGDCAELTLPKPGRRSIEPIWYTGRIMGKTVAKTICGEETMYDPGVWFNSAKFFDIEYQVYGDIPAKTPNHISTLFWQHPKENKSIRLNFDKTTGKILGFNLLGIRYRHKVCEKWIIENTHIEAVLKNLSLANFDPEFSIRYEEELLRLYHQSFKNSVKV